jgi:hypothetical protein
MCEAGNMGKAMGGAERRFPILSNDPIQQSFLCFGRFAALIVESR